MKNLYLKQLAIYVEQCEKTKKQTEIEILNFQADIRIIYERLELAKKRLSIDEEILKDAIKTFEEETKNSN